MPDSLLQAIIGGNPLDLAGLGPHEGGLTILFPLSLGGTVNDLANALRVPVDAILAVNPSLRPDSTLSLSQVVDLPEGHLDRIIGNVSFAGNRAYVSQPSTSRSDTAFSSGMPAESGDHLASLPEAGVSEAVSVPRPVAVVLDLLNRSGQKTPLPSVLEVMPDRWVASLVPASPTPGAGQAFGASVTFLPAVMPAPNVAAGFSKAFDTPAVPISQPPPSTASNQVPASSTSMPAPASSTAGVASVPAAYVEPSTVIAASSQNQGEREAAFNFTRVSYVVVPAGQDRLRNPGSGLPPPPPMDGGKFAAPVASAALGSSGVIMVAPVTVMKAMDLPVDGHPMSLQLMAALLAQSGGSQSGTVDTTPFVDPQALAALVAGQRSTRVIDLGAGRSMQFSLVRDRLQRIDPIGQEQQAGSRRVSDGLQEIRISCPDGEEAEQTDEQREQGRRRRAAIAAMRRRRRPRSRRCCYWRGSRRDLQPAGALLYPKRVDFAEFRRRQPPRYMWTVGGGDP